MQGQVLETTAKERREQPVHTGYKGPKTSARLVNELSFGLKLLSVLFEDEVGTESRVVAGLERVIHIERRGKSTKKEDPVLAFRYP